ncbi:MAG: ectonucleotide pyrophosphatase/phosphodiesterase [Rhodothermaceae bacterium]
MKLIKLLFILFITFTFAQNEKPTTILISFDGFRWDFVDKEITPNLQKIIDRGVHAKSLQPCFPSKTFPNHISIATGMYPENHGIIFNDIQDKFSNKQYTLKKRDEVENSRWYQGEFFWETAERQGVKCGSYFWPGSELKLKYRRATYAEKYEHKRDYTKRVNDVLKWLDLPDSLRPKFITLYFDATDTYGHKYGPDSPENAKAIALCDSMLGKLVNGLTEKQLISKTNIVIVSDHGMTNISKDRVINIEEMLKDFKIEINNTGPVLTINADHSKLNQIFSILKKNENHFNVYMKENMPEHFHFSKHPFIYPIILIADMGWTLTGNKRLNKWMDNYTKGNHGFDNHHMDMHGIFIAAGPSFKKNYRCGTLKNIDIYPLLCEIFKIFPRQNIDGKLDHIKFILKD